MKTMRSLIEIVPNEINRKVVRGGGRVEAYSTARKFTVGGGKAARWKLQHSRPGCAWALRCWCPATLCDEVIFGVGYRGYEI